MQIPIRLRMTTLTIKKGSYQTQLLSKDTTLSLVFQYVQFLNSKFILSKIEL